MGCDGVLVAQDRQDGLMEYLNHDTSLMSCWVKQHKAKCCLLSTDVSDLSQHFWENRLFFCQRQITTHLHQAHHSDPEWQSKLSFVDIDSFCSHGYLNSWNECRKWPISYFHFSSSFCPVQLLITVILTDFITNNFDILCFIGTWLKPGDCCLMVELCPPYYNFLNAPRSTGHGGGIVVLRAIAALFAGSFLVLNHNLLNLSMKYQCVASFLIVWMSSCHCLHLLYWSLTWSLCWVISTFSLIIRIHLPVSNFIAHDRLSSSCSSGGRVGRY